VDDNFPKDKVHLTKKNTNLDQVMHSFASNFFKIIIIVIFQLLFMINTSFSDHIIAKVTGFVDATSPIYILGFDRKFLFEEGSAPLFIVGERDINNFNKINLKAFPHIKIGLFAFQDLDKNGKFSKDFKGEPLEPFGFSLNPNSNYQNIVFEDFVFDMEKFDQLEIKLRK
tara:strand:+ start:161 stop:670 length:510 start_codon:yes stop_codon:yes gene_type:complete